MCISRPIVVKKFYKLKIVVVHKSQNFDASVFDDFIYYNYIGICVLTQHHEAVIRFRKYATIQTL